MTSSPESMEEGAAAENNRCITNRIITLHQRLQDALDSGYSRYVVGQQKCVFGDNDGQICVTHSIDAFLDCLSPETLEHPLVKETIPNMIVALGSIIFGSKNQETSDLASEVGAKIASVFPISTLESHIHDLLSDMLSTLSSPESEVSESSATDLNDILSNPAINGETEVSEILKPINDVADIVQNNHILSKLAINGETEISEILKPGNDADIVQNNQILSKPAINRETEVSEILKPRNDVADIVRNNHILSKPDINGETEVSEILNPRNDVAGFVQNIIDVFSVLNRTTESDRMCDELMEKIKAASDRCSQG